jgi:subtilisin family serine protease
MPFSTSLSRARADGRLTTSEWGELKKALKEEEPTPGKSESAEELVRFVYEGAAAKSVRKDADKFFAARGYHLWYGNYDTDSADVRSSRAELAISRHVSSDDACFSELARVVGDETSELHIAVCDAGFDVSHPALAARLWRNPGEIPGNGIDDDGNGYVDDVHGFDCAENDATLEDTDGRDSVAHGNHVLGVAMKGTSRIRGQVIRAWSGKQDHAASFERSLRYACESGARVVNLSFKVNSAAEVDAAARVMKDHPDVLFVKSAGNDGKDVGSYAAAKYLPKKKLQNMIVVANHVSAGGRKSNSNWGKQEVHLAAWGAGVVSTTNDGSYGRKSGTSMATPLVANTAAKCKLLCDSLTPAELMHLMTSTVKTNDTWKNRVISGGMLNPDLAMKAAAWVQLVRSDGLSEAQCAAKLDLEGAALERVRDAVASLPN